jgi:hypothetical protein
MTSNEWGNDQIVITTKRIHPRHRYSLTVYNYNYTQSNKTKWFPVSFLIILAH